MDLDDVDRRILAELQREGRLSMRELAPRVGVSTPTASSKVKALEAMGLIRGYRAVVDAALLGRAGHVVEVETRPALARALAGRLAAVEGVEEVVETAGGRLFLRYLSEGQAGMRPLLDALATTDDVTTYRVHPIVAERGGERPAGGDARRVDVACHFCAGPIEGPGVRKRWPEDGEREHWFCCRNCAAQFGERLRALSKR
ncbi:MAG TPA: winged helix-turn-helix transcriptional regulator [Candidatus Thermoplasmatota archaeon]|nr:winged helix-turn-helix transcriptional regulator [Candidatus Thermoplasmatota archaeon]